MLKIISLSLLGLTTVGLGVYYAHERAQTKHLASRLDEVEARLRVQGRDLQKQTVAVNASSNEKATLDAEADAARNRLADARAVTPAAGPEPELAVASEASKPPDDPEAKRKMDLERKRQARIRFEPDNRRMYGDLMKQWGLSPSQANTFYETINDYQDALPGYALFQKDRSAYEAAKVKAEEGLKTALGDENYHEYRDYLQTVPQREAVNQFKERLNADNIESLSPAQIKGLIDIMAQENDHRFPRSETTTGTTNEKDATGVSSVQGFINNEAERDQKVTARAATLLTPEQLSSFNQYQESTLNFLKERNPPEAKGSLDPSIEQITVSQTVGP